MRKKCIIYNYYTYATEDAVSKGYYMRYDFLSGKRIIFTLMRNFADKFKEHYFFSRPVDFY